MFKKTLLFLCACLASSLTAQEKPLANTPPMGWNSFDSYGVYLSEEYARKNIDAQAALLKESGYEYFVIDNGWFGEYKLQPGTQYAAEKHASDVRINEYGLLQPSKTYFPNGIKPLADYAHSKGLKFGIHIMRGIPRKAVELNTPIKGSTYRAADIADRKNICRWCHYNYGVDMKKPGAQEFYNSWIAQLAEWGVDFIKADDIVPYPEEVKALAQAIQASGRPIILSLSPGDHVKDKDLPALKQGQMLRVTPDIWDDEAGINQCFLAWKKWEGASGSGFWIDMDMIPFGKLQVMSPPPSAESKADNKQAALAGKGYTRKSRLTPDQMRTFITMRALAASPLMMGGELPGLDEFSLKLLTNKEMISCNQNGVMGKIIHDQGGIIIAKTPLKKGGNDGWIGLFNRTDQPLKTRFSHELLQLPSNLSIHFTNIWESAPWSLDEEHAIPARGVIFLKYQTL